MLNHPLWQQLKRALLIAFVLGLACLQTITSHPAQAEEGKFVDSEGKDLTAVVECLPENYGKADLQSAIAKFGNDYIERVFRLKENTEDYKVSEDEKQFQECLQRKGIKPKA
jgi:hypothetical protein